MVIKPAIPLTSAVIVMWYNTVLYAVHPGRQSWGHSFEVYQRFETFIILSCGSLGTDIKGPQNKGHHIG